MDNIDLFEGVKELVNSPIFSRLEKRFNNLYCHGIATNAIIPDSIYINNSLDLRDVKYLNKVVTLDIDTSKRTSGQEYMPGGSNLDIVFKTKDGIVVGSYSYQENILVLADITHRFNEYTIGVLNTVLDWLDANASVSINSLVDAIKPRDNAYLTIGDTSFVLRAVSKYSTNRKEYVEEVNAKAQKIIKQIKEHWVYQYRKEKDRMDRLRKSVIPMPTIPLDTVLKHNIMISKDENVSYINYVFTVDVVVDSAFEEMLNKQVKVDPPIEYKNHRLIFIVDENNKVKSPIKFLDSRGHSVNHLHTLDTGEVCVGTTKIIGQKINGIDQLIGYKDTLVIAMKTINLSSCFNGSNPELFRKLTAACLEQSAEKIDNSGVWSVSNGNKEEEE